MNVMVDFNRILKVDGARANTLSTCFVSLISIEYWKFYIISAMSIVKLTLISIEYWKTNFSLTWKMYGLKPVDFNRILKDTPNAPGGVVCPIQTSVDFNRILKAARHATSYQWRGFCALLISIEYWKIIGYPIAFALTANSSMLISIEYWKEFFVVCTFLFIFTYCWFQ